MPYIISFVALLYDLEETNLIATATVATVHVYMQQNSYKLF